MVSRASAFDSAPNACPFIALELDRDRRSERPDYRHRCYAEQVPAPRTIAHQERYCLSPNFSGCPIFQDWALRAAARPVPLPPGYEGRRGPADARAAASAAAAAGSTGIASNVAEAQQWPDSMDKESAAAAAAAAGAGSAADSGGTQQLGAFDAPPPGPEPEIETEAEPEPHASPVYEAEDDARDAAEAAALGGVGFAALDPKGSAEPELLPSTPVTDEPAPPEAEAGSDADLGEAAVPAFLAARSARPKAPPKADGPITREEVVPSWELTDRYGAQAGGRSETNGGSGDGGFSKILTAVAVVIILALGIAAVVLIPGLLNSPGATQRPTLALASRTPGATLIGGVATPTVAPSTPTATVEPTAELTPGPTPRTYRVKSGDTLAKIAKKFKITVAALEAANPELTNADHIEVGQILIIPPREAS